MAVKALRAAMRKPVATRSKLLGVKGVALAEATAANLAVDTAPTMAAIERYTGVLYDELDVASLPPSARTRLDEQVVLFSGLWGVLRPDDRIPDYKLKMGATIGRPGKLNTWWRSPVTEALGSDVAGRVVWDLLPHEHRAAWQPGRVGSPDQVPQEIVTVRFLDEVSKPDGDVELVAVAHWNKLLKGSLVRHLLATQLTDVSGLEDFTHPRGYVFDPHLVEHHEGVTSVSFIRPADDPDAPGSSGPQDAGTRSRGRS